MTSGVKGPDFCTFEGCDRKHLARGFCNRHYKRAQKYGTPLKGKNNGHGEGSLTTKGYRYIQINGRRAMEHVFVAERALGRRLPAGAKVHHVDENKLNNAPSNLVICPSESYHQLLHKRMRKIANA